MYTMLEEVGLLERRVMRKSDTEKVQDALSEVKKLDFSELKAKMMGPTEVFGENWDLPRYQFALRWYQRMLALVVVYGPPIAPVIKDIDELWHNHILNTEKYHEDCETLFGFYFHHVPCTPATPAEKLEEVMRDYRMTLDHFRQFFGDFAELKGHETFLDMSGCVTCHSSSRC